MSHANNTKNETHFNRRRFMYLYIYLFIYKYIFIFFKTHTLTHTHTQLCHEKQVTVVNNDDAASWL